MVVHKGKRLTKDRSKELVAAELARVARDHGIEEVAQEAGVTERCIRKAMAQESLPEANTLANIIPMDVGPFAVLAKQFGFKLVPEDSIVATECAAAPCIVALLHKIIEAEQDGRKDHAELLGMEKELREAGQCVDALLSKIDAIRKPRAVQS